MTDKPVIAKKGTFRADLEEGKTYLWCACGRSKTQPLCDGSHKETSIRPIRFVATETGRRPLCGCKQTATPPYCDDTHFKL